MIPKTINLTYENLWSPWRSIFRRVSERSLKFCLLVIITLDRIENEYESFFSEFECFLANFGRGE